MAIDINSYRRNKEIIKILKIVNAFFLEKFPQKSWGWIATTALLYSQMAAQYYLEENTNPGFKSALSSSLMQYQKELNNYGRKEDRHE